MGRVTFPKSGRHNIICHSAYTRLFLKKKTTSPHSVTYITSEEVDKDIVKVTVTESDDVTDDGHDSRRARVGLGDMPPL